MHRFEERPRTRVKIARGGQAKSACHLRTQVAENVAKEVRGHNHLVSLRSANQVHRHGIDVHRVPGDPGEAAADLGEDAPPQRALAGKNVGLVDEGNALAPVLGRVFEGRAHDPLHALVGVQALFGGHLVRRADLEAPPQSGVQPLGVFAEEGDVGGGIGISQRRQGRHQKLAGAEVDVEVRAETQPEQDVAGVRIVRDARVPERAEERRVVVADEPVALLVRDRDPAAQVAVRTEVPGVEGEGDAVQFGCGGKHRGRRPHDFGTDAVPGDYGYPCHRWPPLERRPERAGAAFQHGCIADRLQRRFIPRTARASTGPSRT